MIESALFSRDSFPNDEEMAAKFWKGWREHGGELLSMTEAQLQKEIRNELIDLYFYQAALIEVRRKKFALRR